MSLESDVLAQTRDRAGTRGVSAYVNEAVRRQLRRDALADLLDELREANGPVDPTQMEEARRSWPAPGDEVTAPPA